MWVPLFIYDIYVYLALEAPGYIITNFRLHPRKANMAPENGPLKKWDSYWKSSFLWSILVFRGVSFRGVSKSRCICAGGWSGSIHQQGLKKQLPAKLQGAKRKGRLFLNHHCSGCMVKLQGCQYIYIYVLYIIYNYRYHSIMTNLLKCWYVVILYHDQPVKILGESSLVFESSTKLDINFSPRFCCYFHLC